MKWKPRGMQYILNPDKTIMWAGRVSAWKAAIIAEGFDLERYGRYHRRRLN